MMAEKDRRYLLAAGMAVSVLMCLILAVAIQSARSPEIRTHKDAIAYALRQQGVSYREITFSQTWEESVNLRVFNAAVQVRLADGRTFHGWIGCEQGDRVCFLVLRGAGINGARLPDIHHRRRPAWQRWIDQVIAWFSEQWTSSGYSSHIAAIGDSRYGFARTSPPGNSQRAD
ncbi:MAG: hypothetical protein C0183_17210 [Roseiflexus castenholzii]|uniref:hypothetical protein n=1 Tax=Roseiflexus castenholzii TaxID=120962 RepID=UPI000CC83A01|nr:MAG: hypothetical protein C0183_17210 [Roseiflexus castenholzii]